MSTSFAPHPGRHRHEPGRRLVVIEGVIALCILAALACAATIGVAVTMAHLMAALAP